MDLKAAVRLCIDIDETFRLVADIPIYRGATAGGVGIAPHLYVAAEHTLSNGLSNAPERLAGSMACSQVAHDSFPKRSRATVVICKKVYGDSVVAVYGWLRSSTGLGKAENKQRDKGKKVLNETHFQ